MKIKIDGIGPANKGAQLMAIAIIDRVKKQCPDAVFVLGQYTFKSLNQLVDLYDDIYLKKTFSARIINKLYKLFKISKRDIDLLFLDKDIDVVLDAGGYQYGDSWNHNKKGIAWLSRYYKKLKKCGTKIILLPQAFGPFEMDNSKAIIKTVVEYADLIFPRDIVSHENLRSVFGKEKNFNIYGDFTNILKNTVPKPITGKEKICFIPNQKMITSKGGLQEESDYIKSFVKLIEHIQDKSDNEIILLNHEGSGDLILCNKINERFNNQLTILNELNALQIKEFIAECLFVVSSRYHGIISALNQNIPCLATSWSHKYQELYKEFEISEFVLDKTYSTRSETLINKLLDIKENQQIRTHLKNKNMDLITKTEEMWQKVFAVIENNKLQDKTN